MSRLHSLIHRNCVSLILRDTLRFSLHLQELSAAIQLCHILQCKLCIMWLTFDPRAWEVAARES